MTSRTTINTQNNDGYLHRSVRNNRPLIESVLKLQSPRSATNNPKTKMCVFKREENTVFGFKITGNAPVKVLGVREHGIAWNAGLRENDIILSVNGTKVHDRQHEDVISLIRKNSQVKLFVECYDPNPITVPANSSPKSKVVSPLVPDNSKPQVRILRPNSTPKPTPPKPAPKPKPPPKPSPKVEQRLASVSLSDNSSQKSTPYQSIRQCNNTQANDLNKNKTLKNTYIPPDSSSDCSVTTSSAESDTPTKALSKSVTEIPTKSNSYNASMVTTKHVTKVEPAPKNLSPDKLKHQTIPGDGTRSYTLSMINGQDKTVVDHSSTLPNRKSGGLLHGRDFEDDDMEETRPDNCLMLIKMLSSTKDSLSKPGLVAIILSYVKEKFEDMKIMIFYYVCKLYKSQSLGREFKDDAPRMATEIITTFLLERSPLYLNISVDIISETIFKFGDSERFETIFDGILEKVYNLLKVIVEDIRGKVKRGIQLSEDLSLLITAIRPDINQGNDINLLHRTMCNIIHKSQKDSNINDTVLATQIGLATMYQHFYKSNFLPGASVRARSTDAINYIVNKSKVQTISELFAITTLCAPYQSKVHQSIRKKTKTVNGHLLSESACTQPVLCAVCDGLLWGSSPQGLRCTTCDLYFHHQCKKRIKNQCSKKLRKSNSQITLKEEKPPFFGRLSRKSSTNSNKGDNLNHASLDEKFRAALLDGNSDISKSQSEGQLNGSTINDRSVFGSDGAGSFVNQLNETGGHNADQATVQVHELVSDESLNDPDMKMEESFDAETEIKLIFPNITDTSDKKRLIVLLEFYHKARYILMNLKRFKYILVKKWPPSQEYYFKALSLDCITPFVNLIKSLVTTIELCITDQDFVGLEQAILNWLSDNNDRYLKEWVALSSNLCCTNSLNAVKALKQTTLRGIPELANLLKAKFHKQVMIEELTQIRPLLISLPLISKNIIKCLTKLEPEYSNELVIWKEVSVKMDYLCEYIDRCCIPLVDWINDGSILKRQESFDVPTHFKDFCNDFPRTLFHYPIFDFQIAKILNWNTNTKTFGSYVQTNYFKRGTEVFLIFYQRFIAVLQKENDHWMLKPIKAVTNTIDRRYPIIEIDKDQVWNRGAQEENSYVINIISQKTDTPFLIRIGFSRVEIVDSWLDFVNTKEFSLARSINLFTSTDVAQRIKSSPQFDRTPSMVSNKVKVPSEVFESISMTNSIHERVELPAMDNLETQTATYVALYNKLTTASMALDCNPLLGALLNVPDDSIPNQIKILREYGIGGTDELTVLMCNISKTLVHNTQQLLAKSCVKIEHESEFNLAEVKSMLITTWNLLDKWERSQELVEEIHPKVVLRTESKHRREESEQSLSSDINRTVGVIVHEIIEESMKQVNPSDTDRNSYRYVPTTSLLLSNDYYDVTNDGLITSVSPISRNTEEVIDHRSPVPDIVTRPQIQYIHKQQFDFQ